jgi:hypothetical protein
MRFTFMSTTQTLTAAGREGRAHLVPGTAFTRSHA